MAIGPDEHLQPLRPVAAQIEEVIEVHEPHPLQLLDERRQLVISVNRTDRDEFTFDTELVRRQVQTLIDRLTGEACAVERALANDDRRNGERNRQWHVGLRGLSA